MAGFVLDCSVALSWIFPDERQPDSDRLLERLAAEGALVPELWALEVANVLLVAERRARITAHHCERALQNLQALPIEVDRETHQRALATTFALARAHSLTAYDAAYLELAQRRRLPLASFDTALRTACLATHTAVL